MIRLATISFMLLALSAPHISAQWSSNPTANNPICTEQRNQRIVRAVSDGAGGAILTWEDERPANNTYDIYAQRIDANGNLRWTVNGAPVCTSVGTQNKPQITTDGKGGAYIVWKDVRNLDNDIFMQHLDSNGSMLYAYDGFDLVPPQIKAKEQSDAVICPDGSGGAYIACMDNTAGGTSDNQILLTRVSESTGIPVIQWAGYVMPIVVGSGLYQYTPAICIDGAEGCFVVWQWFRGGMSGQYDLYAQRVSKNGLLYWGNRAVPLCKTPGTQGPASIDYDGIDGVLSAWADYRTSTVGAYSQRLDGTGKTLWPEKKVTDLTSKTDHPFIIGMGNGTGIIVWEDFRNGGTCDLYAQYYDDKGNEKWAKNGVPVCTAPNNQVMAYVVPDGSGGVIIGWEDRRAGNVSTDIYAQRLDANGNILWADNGVVVSNANSIQSAPVIVPTGDGGGIFGWEDYRSSLTNAHVYAFKVLPDGSYPKSQPALTLSSKSVSFGVLGVGAKRDRVVALNNTGGDTLFVHSIRSDNPAFVVRPTSMVIPSGMSQNDSIRFAPTETGQQSARVIIESNSWTSPDTLIATGEGTGTASLEIETKTIAFGFMKLGLRKDSVVVFSNPGLDTLKISEIKCSNTSFTVSNPVANIPPGKTLNQVITFAPRVVGQVNARLTITSNAPSSRDTMWLNGTGFSDVDVMMTPLNIAFGKVPFGTPKDTILEIKNNGTDTLRVTEILSDNAAFKTIPENFKTPPLTTYKLTVRFTPTVIGQNSGELTIYSNSTTSPDIIPVSGIGEADVVVSPASMSFGPVHIGAFKDTVITIENKRADTLRIIDVVSSNAAFYARPLQAAVAPGASFHDTLRFAPSTIGSVSAAISIYSNSFSSPQTINVSGEGLTPSDVTALPGAADYTLHANYPNPFRPVTVIPYDLRKRAKVRLRIENTLGQTVTTLVDEYQNPGAYRPAWDAGQFPSGVYRFILSIDDKQSAGSMLLLQ